MALGSKFFSPTQLKMSTYSKEVLAIYMAFLEFAHILWEATKPTINLTHNNSITSVFQTKSFPPALWNACDYVDQINFKIAHLAGPVSSQQCGCFSLQTGTQSQEKERYQNPGRYPNNTYWSDHIFLGCRWRRTYFLYTSRQKRRVRGTNPWTEGTIQIKHEAMSSKWGSVLLENKCERTYKNRRKHYVVFHERN